MARITYEKKRVDMKRLVRITDDMIWEILLKLPAESIFPCRTVCKSWRNMIESPSFIKDQVEKTARTNTIVNRLILIPGSFNHALYCVVFPLPENLNVASLKELDHPRGRKVMNFVGTCNGLICLEDNVHGFNIAYPSNIRFFTLWNPSTGIHRIVVDKSNIFGTNTYCYFGYDHMKDDYHVIRVTGPSSHNTNDGFIIIDLYSLKKDSWTKIRNQDSWTKIRNQDKWAINVKNGVYISGTLYLVSKHQKIIAFDISAQSFRLFELPPMYDSGLDYILGELNGHLSIMEYTFELKRKHVLWLMNDDGRGMKESLWKTIEIETSEPVHMKKLLPVAPEQMLLFGRTSDHKVSTWCDLKTKSTTQILVQGPVNYLEESEACAGLSTIASPFIV